MQRDLHKSHKHVDQHKLAFCQAIARMKVDYALKIHYTLKVDFPLRMLGLEVMVSDFEWYYSKSLVKSGFHFR